ncbi:MAG TPA: ABC transporter substrate-binding protein, partial [Ktedonobacteraceae bacterium]|nr:ABC transporter substrate-binding protein [Ktedonobacteraceae bacterium]
MILSSVLPVIALSACGSGPATANVPGVVNVVAAENFYGDIVKQLGGSHVSVTSIISNPNVDPHEF